MINIINHSVKIDSIDRLQFFYPDFIVLNKPVAFIDKPIIFTGETKYLNQIKALGVDWIFVSTLAEYDLTKRDVLLDMVFSKYNKKVPKYIQEIQDELDETLFNNLIDYYWLTGKWFLKELESSGLFLKFLQSFRTDTATITKTYLELLKDVSSDYIETSLLTFLYKVQHPNGKLSKWYKQVIDEYSISKKAQIPQAIIQYLNSPIENRELRTYNLILDLNQKRVF